MRATNPSLLRSDDLVWVRAGADLYLRLPITGEDEGQTYAQIAAAHAPLWVYEIVDYIEHKVAS